MKTILGLSFFLLLLSSNSFADDAPVMPSEGCLTEIKTACIGLELSLENCLSQRSDKISASCQQQMQKVMSMANDSSGPKVCLRDVQQYCGQSKPEELPGCLEAHKESFSKPCQDFLNKGS